MSPTLLVRCVMNRTGKDLVSPLPLYSGERGTLARRVYWVALIIIIGHRHTAGGRRRDGRGAGDVDVGHGRRVGDRRAPAIAPVGAIAHRVIAVVRDAIVVVAAHARIVIHPAAVTPIKAEVGPVIVVPAVVEIAVPIVPGMILVVALVTAVVVTATTLVVRHMLERAVMRTAP
jgi:hypothetical protein